MRLEFFDILAPGLPIVFCGINPSTTAAQSGHNFGSPSNRFWKVLHLAGFTPIQLAATEDREILRYGCGITAAVSRATSTAAHLSRTELKRSSVGLRAKIDHFHPHTIAFLGKAAYAAIRTDPNLSWGPQSEPYGVASVWVLPNPSGLNRNFSLNQLVEAYAALRVTHMGALAHWVSGT
jgi:TDG/mug DNA glycosylase family protein